MIVDSIELTLPNSSLTKNRLQGALDTSSVPRLADELAISRQNFLKQNDAPKERKRLNSELGERSETITWKADFFYSKQGERQLILEIQGELDLLCQRCLGVMKFPLTIQQQYRLVATEAEADKLFETDPSNRIEPIAAGKKFDLAALIEDEIILSLPAIRTHDACTKKIKK